MAINPQILAKIFGGTPQGMDPQQSRQIGINAMGTMGASMLAGSRTNQGSAPGFGQVLGQGFLAGQQAQQQGVQNAQRSDMRQMQMQQMEGQLERQKAEKRRRENMLRLIGGGQNYEGQGFAGQAATEATPSALPGLTPQAQQVLQSMSPEMQEQALYQHSGIAPQQETLPAEEIAAMGLPEGTLAQRDPVTGGIKLLREGWDEEAFRQQQAIGHSYDRQLMQMKAQASAGQLDARDKKALNLMQQGMPRHNAYNVVDGIEDYEINEKTGRVVFTNKATGQVREVPIGGQAQEAPYEGPTIWQLNEQDSVTGPGNAAARGANVVGGWLGADIGGEATRGGQFVEATQQNLLRALSNNPRYPVGEMERLREEINLTPSMFDSDEAFRNRAIAIDTALAQRQRNEQRVANDPNQPAEMREGAAQAANDIRNFREQLGVPGSSGQQQAPQGRGQGTPPTIEINQPRGGQQPAQSPPRPEWVPQADWDILTPAQKQALLEAE